MSLLISAVMSIAASIRGPHWFKTPDECLVLARPLNDYLQTLPTKTAKIVAQAFLPLSVVSGAIALGSEPFMIDREIARLRKHGINPADYQGQSDGGNVGPRYQQPPNGPYIPHPGQPQAGGIPSGSEQDGSGFTLRPDGNYSVPTPYADNG